MSTHWADWELTAPCRRELEAELTDHLCCLEQERGAAAAEKLSQHLATAPVRRRLSAPHIADQLIATLNRRPTRAEWRDLLWLLCWFALIIASDLVALRASTERWSAIGWGAGVPAPAGLLVAKTAAWLLQGIARAGFFASFGMSLWRAWSIGSGVWLARVLQLKLLHTVLVITATFALGRALWQSNEDFYPLRTNWPDYITAPVLCAVVIGIATGLWLVTRRRNAGLLLGAALLAVFLYPGGPALNEEITYRVPLVTRIATLTDGTRVSLPETDPQAIAKRIAEQQQRMRPFTAEEINTFQRSTVRDEPRYLPGHINSISPYSFESAQQTRHARDRVSRPAMVAVDYATVTMSPVAVAGAGLGWLAVPIPLLGIVGLLGLVFVMGRRSVVDGLLYALLCGVAIVCTFLPFIFAQQASRIVAFNAVGMVKSPFPGFETLLIGHNVIEGWQLILGLLLSAGIPWLLTSLFLRPGMHAQLPPADERELAG